MLSINESEFKPGIFVHFKRPFMMSTSIESMHSRPTSKVSIEFIIFWLALGDWKLGLITLPVMVLLQSYLIRLMENLWG